MDYTKKQNNNIFTPLVFDGCVSTSMAIRGVEKNRAVEIKWFKCKAIGFFFCDQQRKRTKKKITWCIAITAHDHCIHKQTKHAIKIHKIK